MIGGKTMRDRLRRWCAADRGTALMEFAIVLPVMLALYLGGFELSDAIACNRKVTVTARAIADLTSQYAGVTTTQINTILGASTQVMAPYNTSATLVRVSEISIDNTLHATVTWSQAINGSPRTPGSAFTPPASMLFPGVSLIYSEVSYPYTPMVRIGMLRPVTLTQTIYMMPRVASTVACSDCPAS